MKRDRLWAGLVLGWPTCRAVDLEADVVVIGSGAAGLSAALSAQREGADVLLLEKAATLGGTTIKSSAWAWYPNHAGVRRDGHVDEKADAMRYMARLSAPETYDPESPDAGAAGVAPSSARELLRPRRRGASRR